MSQKVRKGFASFFDTHSLRIQLLSRSLLILAFLLVLIGLLQYLFMRDVIYKNKAESLRSQVLSIPLVAWLQLENNPFEGDRRFYFIPDSSLVFVDLNGNYSILSNRPGGPNPPRLDVQEYADALKKKPGLNYRVVEDTGGKEQLLVLLPIFSGHEHPIGVVQVSTATNLLKELLIRQLLAFLLLSLLAMIFGLLGFLPILKRTLIPLFNMVKTAEQIDAGNLTRRFPTQQGQTEIDRLSESFNGMLDRLEASFKAERETKEQMRRFIADASHELRTPLTSIHGFLEVLLRGAANQPDQLHKALQSMYSESDRLNKLVHDLLLLAKLDRQPHIECKEGFLNTIIQDMEPQLRILAGNRKLSMKIESDMRCKYDEDKIKQVILNLFQNAVQHTDPEKGHIQISLLEKNNGVELSVQDNGPGIREEHLPNIFDRFYRIDTSRTRKSGGAGLGLAITKSIVDAHGGTIHVSSKEGEGCTFRVWIPKELQVTEYPE